MAPSPQSCTEAKHNAGTQHDKGATAFSPSHHHYTQPTAHNIHSQLIMLTVPLHHCCCPLCCSSPCALNPLSMSFSAANPPWLSLPCLSFVHPSRIYLYFYVQCLNHIFSFFSLLATSTFSIWLLLPLNSLSYFHSIHSKHCPGLQ